MTAQDVVYYFAPKQDVSVTISLCASAAYSDAFDTKLYVVEDLLTRTGRVTAQACNDDYCGYQSQLNVGHHHTNPGLPKTCCTVRYVMLKCV